jgi:alkylation response protein AidB-like acyl-CoA dehydrogenase
VNTNSVDGTVAVGARARAGSGLDREDGPPLGLDELRGILVADRSQADATARMTPEVRRAATAAGMWTLVAPREVGGGELSLPRLAALFEQLGRADPTFCWIAINSITTELMGAYLPADIAADVLADADGPFGSSGSVADMTAVRVEGGWAIDASLRFMTGSADARWCTALGVDASSPQSGLFFFVIPMSELEVGTNWVTATAMRGTGSSAVTGTGVFVPDERVIPFSRPPRLDRPLFRMSPFVTLWLPCAATVIGILRAAMDGRVEMVANKRASDPTRTPYIEAGRLQHTLADTAAATDSLSAGLRSVAEDVWAAASAGESPPPLLRSRWWSVLFYVLDTARRAVSDLYRSSGSAVYGAANPVERAMRDVHAISVTFEQPSIQALRGDAGRVLAGKPAKLSIF